MFDIGNNICMLHVNAESWNIQLYWMILFLMYQQLGGRRHLFKLLSLGMVGILYKNKCNSKYSLLDL